MTRLPFRVLFPVLYLVLAGFLRPTFFSPAAQAADTSPPAAQAAPAQTPAPLIADITLFASDATLNAMGDEIRAIYQAAGKTIPPARTPMP
nr:hypothetical protein [Acetobacter persici]